jgi:type IV secretory pathway TraG/TraD family ATPase VirD4
MGLLKTLLGGLMPADAPSTRLTLGGVEIEPRLEPYHFLLAGSTGTGKTTLVDEALATIVPRGDRVIVCDPDGHHLACFHREGDVVLNPFDRRSPGWSVFNEVRRDFDYDRLAKSVVPPAHGGDAQWHHYAQVLLSEALRALMLKGETTTAALMHWCTTTSKDELAKLLEGTPAQGLFDADAAKALASTRFILTSFLAAHKYMKPGDFSLRRWLEEGDGNLYLTWREDMQSALMPLVGCWVDVLANAVLSLPADKHRRVWLVLDELGGLGRLNSLEASLTRGRKHGLCVIAGLQSTAQLDRAYSREGAVVLRSCFRNLVVLGIAKSDPDTADVLSRALGEREIERMQRARTSGPQGITAGVTLQHASERIAMASEIAELPDLTAYVALAGAQPTVLVNLTPRELPEVTNAMEE